MKDDEQGKRRQSSPAAPLGAARRVFDREIVPRVMTRVSPVVAALRPPSRAHLAIERMEVDFVLSRLGGRSNLRVVDIGAHHGELLDILYLHPDRPMCDVICAEPEHSNLRVIRTRLPFYRRFHVLLRPVGVSDTSGTRTFFTASETTLFTCTPEWKSAFPDAFRATAEVDVHCLTFSDLLQSCGVAPTTRIDFVKVDTEGHDLNVIRSIVQSRVLVDAVMFEIGLDDEAAECACELLDAHGFDEIYIFARVGATTTYVGDRRSSGDLDDLRECGKLSAGNIVAFRRE